MGSPVKLIHLVLRDSGKAVRFKDSLELFHDNLSVIIHADNTLNILARRGEVLVLEASPSDPEWLRLLAMCLRDFPSMPVVVYSPDLRVKEGLERIDGKSLLYATNDLRQIEQKLQHLALDVAGGRKTVLLVDDDPFMLKALTRLLRRSPWNIYPVSSAERAMNILNVEKVDVVVTDIKMPGVHGIQLIGQIRKQHHDLPVIVCSGYPGMREDPELAIHRVADFIEKPVDPDTFEDRIAAAMFRP